MMASRLIIEFSPAIHLWPTFALLAALPSSIHFVGLPDDRKGYKLLNAYSHQLIYSRDVDFHEDEFPPSTPPKPQPHFDFVSVTHPTFHPLTLINICRLYLPASSRPFTPTSFIFSTANHRTTTHQAQADGFNYAEWADHIEQKISQQKLRKYLTSSTRFEHYDEDDDYVAKSYINLSVHRKNLKYFKETDLEKAHPSTIHTNLARHRLKDVHEKTTIVNNMLLRRELWSLSWKPHETYATFVDWILERITKQDPEYCSLIGVIKSVEIGWSFMALHGHQGRSKRLDPSHYLQQLVRIRCEGSASVTADVESAYLVANEAPSIWHARLGYPPPAPTQAILKATNGGPSKLPSPDSCDGCVCGEMPEIAHPRYGERGSKPLGTNIHAKAWGPSPV
ncbi:hypothetical protein H257_05962 [Aphanomyces astaci]|uniref:Retroviral polymerase SH3-like domain-containing protein n=1 Tax=Aphanomyces astaci TaxID=112090 RepID=W4GRC2_APHAT|nr:hypothetical protein H257_05962 [Aphanomyces astaci]ETV81438.1 hypothetical protein H257_05962 [Aphanomyces astaci]|eukprot:XP_009829296.1 hypothetical protein H257_05962 [Aphanomyces astaci]